MERLLEWGPERLLNRGPVTSDFKSDFLGHLQKLVFFLEFREANPARNGLE